MRHFVPLGGCLLDLALLPTGARAAEVVSAVPAPTPVAASGGTTVFSQRDSATGTFSLMVANRAGVRPLPVRPRSIPST
jgi:hypothetical protein